MVSLKRADNKCTPEDKPKSKGVSGVAPERAFASARCNLRTPRTVVLLRALIRCSAAQTCGFPLPLHPPYPYLFSFVLSDRGTVYKTDGDQVFSRPLPCSALRRGEKCNESVICNLYLELSLRSSLQHISLHAFYPPNPIPSPSPSPPASFSLF